MNALANPSGALFETSEPQLLAQEEAFKLQADFSYPNQIDVNWTIAPGTYLYKESLKVYLLFNPDEAIALSLPDGTVVEDAFKGSTEIFRDRVSLRWLIPNETSPAAHKKFIMESQGCADIGICYPPQKQLIHLTFKEGIADISIEAYSHQEVAEGSTNASDIEVLYQNHHWLWVLLSFFAIGIGLTFTPCVLPMIPILASVIVGTSEYITRYKAIRLTLVYVFSMALVYALMGVIAATLGQSLQAQLQQPWLIAAMSGLFGILALSMFGFFHLQLPHFVQTKLNSISHRQPHGQYIGAAVMGTLSSIIVSPCLTPALAGSLIYIANTGNELLGGAALFVMGLGMGVPLLVVGTFGGALLPKSGQWMEQVKHVFGMVLLLLAVWMLDRILPRSITLGLVGAVLLVSAVIFWKGVHAQSTQPLNRGSQRLWQGIALLVGGLGIIYSLSAGYGGRSLLNPIDFMSQQDAGARIGESLHFTPATSVQELEVAIADAKRDQQPILIKYYADWCVSCKNMEETLFNDVQVVRALADVRLIVVDVTANNPTTKALQQRLKVFAPPTLIFFKSSQDLQSDVRLIGEISASAFLAAIGKSQF